MLGLVPRVPTRPLEPSSSSRPSWHIAHHGQNCNRYGVRRVHTVVACIGEPQAALAQVPPLTQQTHDCKNITRQDYTVVACDGEPQAALARVPRLTQQTHECKIITRQEHTVVVCDGEPQAALARVPRLAQQKQDHTAHSKNRTTAHSTHAQHTAHSTHRTTQHTAHTHSTQHTAKTGPHSTQQDRGEQLPACAGESEVV
jgi:ribosomal protein L36